ncbi:MAG: carbonic anhydrase [Planctomycetota bacterium]|nr:carbonic anhydrase [Planctomycetota bacterium]
MSDLSHLLTNNRVWAEGIHRTHPVFFGSLTAQQRPKFLWIGCSDSRVPANEIIGLMPGEVFVHRNVANLVVHSDLNCLSVIDYAVNELKIKDIIVCGHYGCGGVNSALAPSAGRFFDHWIRHVRDIAKFYRSDIESEPTAAGQARKLCELNVAVQVVHVRESPILQHPAARGVTVHGWIYDIADGLLHDLCPMIEKVRALEPPCARA